jgi:tRNA pseudouridine65 synthase
LFEDDVILAMDKPSGMIVHRGWGWDDVVLVDLVREISGEGKVHPVHRLDRGTSGVVLFARGSEIAAKIQACFESGRVVKRYLALVRGVAPDHGEIDHPIPRKKKGPRVEAQTAFRRLASAETEPRHVSLVEAFPKTGRLHQVRRHLKHIDHPIIGDANYGKGQINREMAERYGLERLALHAASLRFEHPITGAPVEIQSPIPIDLHAPLERMGLGSVH